MAHVPLHGISGPQISELLDEVARDGQRFDGYQRRNAQRVSALLVGDEVQALGTNDAEVVVELLRLLAACSDEEFDTSGGDDREDDANWGVETYASELNDKARRAEAIADELEGILNETE